MQAKAVSKPVHLTANRRRLRRWRLHQQARPSDIHNRRLPVQSPDLRQTQNKVEAVVAGGCDGECWSQIWSLVAAARLQTCTQCTEPRQAKIQGTYRHLMHKKTCKANCLLCGLQTSTKSNCYSHQLNPEQILDIGYKWWIAPDVQKKKHDLQKLQKNSTWYWV